MRAGFFIDTLEHWIFGLDFSHHKYDCVEGSEEHKREASLCIGKISIGIMVVYHRTEIQEDSFGPF